MSSNVFSKIKSLLESKKLQWSPLNAVIAIITFKLFITKSSSYGFRIPYKLQYQEGRK